MSHPNRVSAIAVGVSQYDHLGRLDGPHSDVENLRRVLTGNDRTALLSASQFVSLTSPTSAEVREALSAFAHSSGAANDVLLFYFSGHAVPVGNRDLGLCTRDSFVHPNFHRAIPTSMLLVQEVLRVAAAVSADPIIILDACYSGEAIETIRMVIDEAKRQVQAETGSAYALMSSCTPIQTSIDTDSGGVFSQALCKAASDGDSTIPYPELSIHDLYRQVRGSLEQSDHEMDPMLYVGETFPTFGFVKNVQYRPRREGLQPYMVDLMRYLWNEGNPDRSKSVISWTLLEKEPTGIIAS